MHNVKVDACVRITRAGASPSVAIDARHRHIICHGLGALAFITRVSSIYMPVLSIRVRRRLLYAARDIRDQTRRVICPIEVANDPRRSACSP